MNDFIKNLQDKWKINITNVQYHRFKKVMYLKLNLEGMKILLGCRCKVLINGFMKVRVRNYFKLVFFCMILKFAQETILINWYKQPFDHFINIHERFQVSYLMNKYIKFKAYVCMLWSQISRAGIFLYRLFTIWSQCKSLNFLMS